MPQWRGVALLCVGFFLITSILTAFFVIPKINESIEENYERELRVDSKLEAELFIRFIESQKALVSDISQHPSLTNAVMLSSGASPKLIELLDNVTIKGEKGHLVLQDIAGNILLKTSDKMQASYSQENSWLNKVLNGDISYHLQLLEQEEASFTFKISVPVIYSGNIEGVLSAEITAPLDQIFIAQLFDEFVAIKLIQDHVFIKTDTDKIKLPKETPIEIKEFGVTFIHISDETLFRAKTAELRNTILAVLFVGLAISFILFFIFSYKANVLRASATREDKKYSTYAIPLLIAVVGISATITASRLFENMQAQKLQEKTVTTMRGHSEKLQRYMTLNMEALDSIRALYDASENVDRMEFKAFVKSTLQKYPNIQALSWIPNVPHEQRLQYEQRAREDGLTDFSITERQNDLVVPAAERDHYFPVYFIEPVEGNEKAIGFDLASNASRLMALNTARDTGKKVATARITLVQEEEQQAGVLIFNPLYKNSLSDANNSEEHLDGLTSMVLRVGDMVTNIFADDLNNISLRIQDITDEKNIEELYASQSEQKLAKDDFTYSEAIDFAGRQWKISVTPYEHLIEEQTSVMPWLIMGGGSLFSLLIAHLLLNQIRRREAVEAIVEERTAELMELQQAMQLAIEGVSKIDPEGRYTYVNDSYAGKIGYTPEELVGRTWDITIVKEQLDRMNDVYQTMLKDGKVVEETIGQHKDGSTVHKQVTMISDYNKEGEFVGHFCFMQDITARKDAELEREKLIDRLANSNEELERFAYVCSHDMQEPLRMIRSFSEKLQDHITDMIKDDEKAQRYFRFVIDGATRAQQLIADILAYSSVDQSTQKPEVINMNDLVGVVQVNMQVNLEERGGSITHDDLPDLKGNKTQLYQLLQNLINNGLKYQKPDTKPHVHVGIEDADTHWQFSVKDNGIGMEDRHLKKIFDVFQRLHRKEEYAGTGVGLSICKKVVERHGGKIWVESEKDKGSIFIFTILKPTSTE